MNAMTQMKYRAKAVRSGVTESKVYQSSAHAINTATNKVTTAIKFVFLKTFQNVLNSRLETVWDNAYRTSSLVIGRKDVPTEVEVNGVMVEVPADLRDTESDYTYAEDGTTISGLMTSHDMALGADKPAHAPAALFLVGTLMVTAMFIAMALSFFIDPVVVFATVVTIGCVLAWHVFAEDGVLMTKICALSIPTFGMYLPFMAWKMAIPQGGTILVPHKEGMIPAHFDDRESLLHYQAGHDGAGLSNKGFWSMAQRARYIQATNAIKDNSQFIRLGESTGIISNHGSRYAPDASLDFGLTVHDSSQHLIVFGETGSGKTESVGIPYVEQYCQGDGGAVVFCGKNQLAQKLKGRLAGYKLLSPSEVKINLFAGMNALDVTEALAIRGEREEGDWYESARNFWFQNATILYAVAMAKLSDDYKWTPACLRKIVADNITQGLSSDSPHGTYRTKAIELANTIKDSDVLLSFSVDWMTGGDALATIRAKGFSSTADRMNNWLFPLFNHPAIAQWATTASDDGFDVATVCTGARFGFDFGADCGEDTTKIMNNIVRQRIYVALRNRGDDWKAIPGQTDVLFLIDEAHIVLNDNDAQKTSIVRSGGGKFVCMTQSVKALHDAMGKEKADAMLSNFVNAVAFKTNDDGMTDDFMAIRCGTIMRHVYTIYKDDGEQNGFNAYAHANLEYAVPRNHGDDINGGVLSIHKTSVSQKLVGMVKNAGMASAELTSTGIFGNKALATYDAITPAEIRLYLSEPYMAVAAVKRGKVMRHDVIRCARKAA